MYIHSSAVIDDNVHIGRDVEIGPYSIIEKGVTIGDGTIIESHVRIGCWTTLGKKCRIHHGASIGSIPQDLKFKNTKSYTIVGDNNVFREYVTVNRGTGDGDATEIGSDNYLMAYVHIAHNCVLGNNIILANAVNLAGHVDIEDYAGIGGITPVHQFVRIGQHSFIGGGSRIPKDIVPYVLAAGNPLRMGGLNIVGLKRRGFSSDVCENLRKAYNLLFLKGFNTSQAVEQIREELPMTTEIKNILDFIARSTRGIEK
jgi:UDP-N-acetylglucosamine acyltransferase